MSGKSADDVLDTWFKLSDLIEDLFQKHSSLVGSTVTKLNN